MVYLLVTSLITVGIKHHLGKHVCIEKPGEKKETLLRRASLLGKTLLEQTGYWNKHCLNKITWANITWKNKVIGKGIIWNKRFTWTNETGENINWIKRVALINNTWVYEFTWIENIKTNHFTRIYIYYKNKFIWAQNT